MFNTPSIHKLNIFYRQSGVFLMAPFYTLLYAYTVIFLRFFLRAIKKDRCRHSGEIP